MYVLANKNKQSSGTGAGGDPQAKQEGFALNNREIPKTSSRNHPRVHPQQPLRATNFPINPQHQPNDPIPAGEPIDAYQADLRTEPGYYPNAGVAIDRYYLQSTHENSLDKDKSVHLSLTGDPMTKSNMKHNNMVPFFGSKVKGTTYDHSRHEGQLDAMQGAGSQYIHKQEQAPLFAPQEHMGWAYGTPNQTEFIRSRINPSSRMANVKPWEEERVAPGLNQPGSSMGSGGFNSAMESRERWMPKTVDDLRVRTNPKVTYDGVVLGGQAKVQNRGMHGRVEKQGPDTYFINTPDRYLTTTGVEKAQTARATQILRPENRSTTTREYFGATKIKEGSAQRAPQQFHPSNRPELDAPIEHVSNIHARGQQHATTADYGIQGYTAYTNGRSLTTTRQPNLGGVHGIAKAVISPLLDMLRPSRKENMIGNARPAGNATTTVKQPYVYNPAERAKPTIRELTEVNPYPMNIGNSAYQGYGHLTNEHQSVEQNRDTTSTEYMGTRGVVGAKHARTYDAEYNGRTNPNKEIIAQARTNHGNHNVFNGYMNIKVDKRDCDREQQRWNVPQNTVKHVPSVEMYGQTNSRSDYGQSIHMDRNQPEVLDAFRSNPYAKSLHSWA